MNIAICDDEKWLCRKLENQLTNSMIGGNSVQSFFSGDALLFAMKDTSFDMIFLDIELEKDKPLGLTVGKEIRKQHRRLPIVFLTAHSKYLEAGYEIHPFHYLLKSKVLTPFGIPKLYEVMDAIKEEIHLYWGDYWSFYVRGGIEHLPKKDIIYMENIKHTVFVYTAERVYRRSHITTKEIMLELADKRFFSPHVSFIFNMEYFERITDAYERIILRGGHDIPLSQKRRGEFVKYLADLELPCR